mgnify:FL=1
MQNTLFISITSKKELNSIKYNSPVFSLFSAHRLSTVALDTTVWTMLGPVLSVRQVTSVQHLTRPLYGVVEASSLLEVRLTVQCVQQGMPAPHSPQEIRCTHALQVCDE